MADFQEAAGGLMVPQGYKRQTGSTGWEAPTSTPRGVDTSTEAQFLESMALLQERIAELELGLEDQGYRLLGTNEFEFSRAALTQLIRLARIMYLKNPLVRRGVNLQSLYVWGQGVNITSKQPDANRVLQKFLDDKANRAELTGSAARSLKEIDLQVTGNIFLVIFTDKQTGAVSVRSIPVDEMQDVTTDPEDRRVIRYYKRVYTARKFNEQSAQSEMATVTAWYPDWRYDPGDQKPERIGTDAVKWDARVYHVKVGGLENMLFGVPEIYPVIDWALAYKDSLTDDASRSRALTRFAYSLTTKGGIKQVAAAKTKLATTFGSASGSQETNPPPTTGATFIQSDTNKLAPINLNAAALPGDHNKPLRLMIAAGFGFPDTFFGDVDVGNLATAKSLDRPTELKIRDRQQLWDEVLTDLGNYVIWAAMKAPGGGIASLGTADADGTITWDVDEKTGQPVDGGAVVEFPPILEQDLEKVINAIIKGATLDGKQPVGTITLEDVARMVLTALGQKDVDVLLARAFPAERDAEGEQGAEDQTEAALTEAVRDLVRTLQRIGGQEGGSNGREHSHPAERGARGAADAARGQADHGNDPA